VLVTLGAGSESPCSSFASSSSAFRSVVSSGLRPLLCFKFAIPSSAFRPSLSFLSSSSLPVTAHCLRIDRLKVAHALMIRLLACFGTLGSVGSRRCQCRASRKFLVFAEVSCVCRSSCLSWKRMREEDKKQRSTLFLKSDVLSFSNLTSCPRLSRPSII
jgi:hypothetical protein